MRRILCNNQCYTFFIQPPINYKRNLILLTPNISDDLAGSYFPGIFMNLSHSSLIFSHLYTFILHSISGNLILLISVIWKHSHPNRFLFYTFLTKSYFYNIIYNSFRLYTIPFRV